MKKNYVDISELLVLGYDGEEIVGYSGYQFGVLNEERYVYLCGGTLKLKAQGLNHFPKVHTEIAGSGLVDLMVMRTQNPRVYAALKKVDGITVYPSFDLSTTERIRAFAQQFSKEKLNQEINPDTFVAAGTYGGCLYDEMPSHDVFSNFFTIKLGMNFHRGDSVILIGEINH